MTPWRSPHERWRRQKTGGGNAEIAARFPHYHRHDGYGITSPKPAHYGIRILRARSHRVRRQIAEERLTHPKKWSNQFLRCRNSVLILMRQEEPPVSRKLRPD